MPLNEGAVEGRELQILEWMSGWINVWTVVQMDGWVNEWIDE